MDTSPDVVPHPQTQPSAATSNADNTVVTHATFRIGMTARFQLNSPSPGQATLLDTPSLTINLNGMDQPTDAFPVIIPNATVENVNANSVSQPPPPQRDDSVESRVRRERRGEDRQRDQDDASSESSSDDEENPYWASFKEDTSSPDERELKVIEESEKNMSTADDHEHWENTTFEPLGDPEYIPADIGRISWVCKDVHGTPDKPNRESVMRSPSVQIGDYYWNIKFYPRGNEGTEQVSVYIECSPRPYEDEMNESKDEAEKKAEAIASNDEPSGEVGAVGGSHADGEQSEAGRNGEPMNTDNGAAPSMNGAPAEESQAAAPTSTTSQNTGTANPPPGENKSEGSSLPEARWRVPAQVCCVMYNPNEPRVYATQKSTHNYCNDNPDWGWTRFHGPWDDLHQRKRYQRSAILRDDTLAFTVYIRTVNDPTHCLWWHPPKDKTWDCVEMTGLHGFRSVRPEQSSGIISAVSSWAHLKPFLDIIRDTRAPDAFFESGVRPRPMLDEFQSLLHGTGEHAHTQKGDEYSLSMVATLMDVNSFEGIRKMDVVALWEHLRRLLTLEISDAGSVEASSNLQVPHFEDMLLLKQPDPFDDTMINNAPIFRPKPRNAVQLPKDHEPVSVQEVVDLASLYPDKAFNTWECFPNSTQAIPEHPNVVQIELRRQHFDQIARSWMKLGHRIAIDEQIMLSDKSYTLYGIIVHSGSLESQEFYSIVRPEGPGSRWIKFAGENCPRRVEIVTTMQAIQAHEGTGEPILEKSKSDKKKENAAVAYVATYVRTDAIKQILEVPFDHRAHWVQKKQEIPASEEPPAPAKNEDSAEKSVTMVPVDFYCGDTFSGLNELETFDPWSQRLKEDVKDSCLIFLPETTKIRDVKAILDKQLQKISSDYASKVVKLWLLDARRPCLGSVPAFHPYEPHADRPLDKIPQFVEGCRFWIGGQEIDVLRQIMGNTKDEGSENLLNSIKEDSSSDGDQPTTAPEATASPTTEQGVDATNADTTVSDQPAPEAGSQPTEQGDSGDTVMSDALNDTVDVPAPAEPEPSDTPPQPEQSSSQSEERQLLCFLKVFDFEAQTLKNTTYFSAPVRANVEKEVKKALGVETRQKAEDEMSDVDPPQEEWDVYHERFQFTKAYDLVSSNAVFENFIISLESLGISQDIIPTDGVCFIAQRRPDPEQYVPNPLPRNALADQMFRCAALDAAGKPSSVPAFVSYLLAQAYNPTYASSQRTTSYLGSPYFSGSQSYARPHGQGTLVTMSGNTYNGSFVSGQKSGTGEMIYANKDVYEGDWEHDEPHGQGKMSYTKWGNMFEGGFKKGKRYGKGTMHYTHTEDEMKLCQVCYEEEMDTLFYACGHVCACEPCARQVETCPVCRERVRGTVKVRWTV